MRKLNSKIVIGIAMLIGIMLIPNMSKAALQANKGGSSKGSKSVSDFFLEIRQMEAKGGTLGKETNINSTYATGSPANGIDCHMIKNTEFGTAAMLAASDCGSITTTGKADDASTTGNESGIYQMAGGKFEFVAGGLFVNADTHKNLYNASSIYKNIYKVSPQEIKAGDAMLECQKWYGSQAEWITDGYSTIIRGTNGFFAYQRNNGAGASNITSRAAVVCGSSFN